MKTLFLILIGFSLFSCSSSPNVETSGLMVNETKGEYYLHFEKISEKQAKEYIAKNSKSDEIVVFVEGKNVGAYTLHQATEGMTSLFKTLFSHKVQPLDQSSIK